MSSEKSELSSKTFTVENGESQTRSVKDSIAVTTSRRSLYYNPRKRSATQTEGTRKSSYFYKHPTERIVSQTSTKVFQDSELEPKSKSSENVELIKSGVNADLTNEFLQYKQKGRRSKKMKTKETYKYVMKSISIPLLFRPLYILGEYLEWILCAVIFAEFFLVTYQAVFSLYISEFYDVLIIIDSYYLCDIIIRLAIEIWRSITDTPVVITVVPYTLNQYLLDLISSIPVERVYYHLVDEDNLLEIRHYDFLRINRLLRFSRCFKFFSQSVKERRSSEGFMFIINYFTLYLGFIQLVACIFFAILPADPLDFLLQRKKHLLKESWFAKASGTITQHGDRSYDHYVLSLSFSTAVVTTTGYGDISPASALEMIIAAIVMFIGAIILSGMFSSGLGSFKLEHDGARFDLYYRLSAIVHHLKHINSHELFTNKVIEYYNLLWNYREGVFEVTFIEELPEALIEDMFFDICQEMFHKSQLFRGLDEKFLRAVSAIVQVVLYNPNMILCSAGDYAMNMFYILQGEIRIKSKLKPNSTAGILRAGSIFGEVNLFFSYPYTTTIETRTCCQLLVIRKFDLFELFEHNDEVLEVLRDRVQTRVQNLKSNHEMIGREPVCWVQYKDDHSTSLHPLEEFPIEMRKGKGFNKRVVEDIVDDTDETMIADMPCLDKKYEKKHTTVFSTCVIPPILTPEDGWVNVWNMFIMFIALMTSFLSPYCLSFTPDSPFLESLCTTDKSLEYVVSMIYIVDVFVELAYAAPVTGIYFKLVDGFHIKISQITFWVDLVCALPVVFFTEIENRPVGELIETISVILKCLKLWKILRYFNYIDNVHPNKLFLFRLGQTMFFMVYGTHALACILYSLACQPLEHSNTIVCNRNSWLHSFTDTNTGFRELAKYDVLGIKHGYLVSFYFACATVSTAGFGDFSPQSIQEMMFLILFELLSFGLIGYFTALLTSALSCTVRPKLVFQQKLIGIRQFMEHKGLLENLQSRIIEHYYLQDQLWCGVSLPPETNHFMYDTPAYLQEDALYLEVELHFDGVPVFTKLPPKTIVEITKLTRRYLIPPGAIFLRKGEVRRQMYIIGRGSVGFITEKETEGPLKILEETGHFGIRDLLFGEPAHYHVKTLSYCLLYEVELRDLMEALNDDVDLLKLVDDEKAKLQKGIDAMIREYSQYAQAPPKEKVQLVPSWIYFPKHPVDLMSHCTYEEYEAVFGALKYPWIFRHGLMRKSIHPAGKFSKIWVGFISLIAALQILCLFNESFMGLRSVRFRVLQGLLDIINWMDVYLKLHWAYYTSANLLISHPVQTAIRYVYSGPFFFDVAFCIPYECIILLLRPTHILGYGDICNWYSLLKWTRFGQILRTPAILSISHSIFKMRSPLLLAVFLAMTLIVGSGVVAIALNMACPVGQAPWTPDDERKLPFCNADTWVFKKGAIALQASGQRWVYGIYYVCQVMFVIGFGDMTTTSNEEMLLLIFVMLFGFILTRCILADLTAAEVDIDEVRQTFIEEIKTICLVMAREKVHSKIVGKVRRHQFHTWSMSKGLKPRKLFEDLHPALEADLFRNLVGEDLEKVPIFSGFRENIQRTLCQYMNTIFFRRGERITRYGNFEQEMFVVVNGKVWITNSKLDWITTLAPGESFGEVSILYDVRREYNAVAATDVELFVLSVDDFQQVLQRYPAVEDDLKDKLQHKIRDLFQQDPEKAYCNKRSKELCESVSHEVKEFLYQNEIPDPDEEELFLHKKIGWFKEMKGKLFGYGSLDMNIPFFYLATGHGHKIPFLIHPKCGFMNSFLGVICWLCYLTTAIAVYELFFHDDELTSREVQDGLDIFSYFLESIFWVHIALQFITPFLLWDGSYCKEFGKIVYNYTTTFSKFWLDVISSVWIPHVDHGSPSARFWKFLRCVRFLRLHYFYSILLGRKSDLTVSTFRYKISMSISSFILMAHFLACIFYGMSPCLCSHTEKKTGCTLDDLEDMCTEDTWTLQFVKDNTIDDIILMKPYHWYIRSMYWVITTVSTTGFGDITPINVNETAVGTVTIFCGSFVLSIILGHFTVGTASLGKTKREFMYNANLLNKHMGNIGMSQDKRDQVMSYFVMRWETSRGVLYHNAVSILPSTMKTEVCYALYYNVVMKCKLFASGTDTAFIRQLCSVFTHEMFIPGINVVNDGYQEKEEKEEGVPTETTGSMFLVYKGRIAGYKHDSEEKPILLKTYEVGKLFGKSSGLFYDQPYNKTYRAEMQSEVLKINQKHLIQLVQQFPEFANNVMELIMKRYDPKHYGECIFEKKPQKKEKDDFEDFKMKKEGSEKSIRPEPPPTFAKSRFFESIYVKPRKDWSETED